MRLIPRLPCVVTNSLAALSRHRRPFHLLPPKCLGFLLLLLLVIKGLALIAMAFLVEDCDLDLIQLDCDTLQYFLDTTAASFASQGLESEGWQTDAVVHGLSQFARNDVNRRRIVAQGPRFFPFFALIFYFSHSVNYHDNFSR